MRLPQPLLPVLLASALPLACGGTNNPADTTQESQAVEPDVQSAQQTPVDPQQEAAQALADAFAEEFASSLQASFDEYQRIHEQGGTPEEIAAYREHFENSNAMTVDQAREAWMAPSDLAGATVGEVLTALGAVAGLPVDTNGLEEHLDAPCEVDPEGKSVVHMLEATCRSIGVTPVYPEGNPYREDGLAITFEDGPRSEPMVFAGPFMIRTSEVSEHAPYASGEVRVEALAIGLPEGMQSAAHSMGEWIRVEAVVDEQQNNLRQHVDMTTLSQPQRCQNVMRVSTSEDLTSLLRGVEAIDSIEGKVTISIPTEVHELVFTPDRLDRQTVAGLEVNLKKLDTQCEMTVRGANADSLVVTWSPMIDAQTPMGVQHQSSYFFDETLEASLSLPAVPQALHVKLLETQTFSFPFELEDLPLQKYEQQPEARQELRFEGDTPVTFEFVAFQERDSDFPKVTLTTHNHTNKDIQSVQARFVYFDSLDNEIKDSYTTMQSQQFSMEPTPMVRAGEPTTGDHAAFFMPPETQYVRVTLSGIDFMDGTSWQSE